MDQRAASVRTGPQLGRERNRPQRALLLAYPGPFADTALVLVGWAPPSLLTEYPRTPKSADRHRAFAHIRTGLVAMLAAMGAAGGPAYTARTYRPTTVGQPTDRCSEAVEQLGDEEIEVRLRGIHVLERLAGDSRADQPTIMEPLAAFGRHGRCQAVEPADRADGRRGCLRSPRRDLGSRQPPGGRNPDSP